MPELVAYREIKQWKTSKNVIQKGDCSRLKRSLTRTRFYWFVTRSKQEFTQGFKTTFDWSVSMNGSGSLFQKTLVGQERMTNP